MSRATGTTDQQARAAAAVRALTHLLAERATPQAELAAVADRLEDLVDEMQRMPHRDRGSDRAVRRVFALDAGAPSDVGHDPLCTVCGEHNPLAVDIDYELVHERHEVRARVRLGPAHEGVPGRGHGAVIAAVFEDVIAHVLLFDRQPGVTGSLRVDYRAPFPVPDPVRFRAWEERRRGRSIVVAAEATTDLGVVATARSTLVTVPLERLVGPSPAAGTVS